MALWEKWRDTGWHPEKVFQKRSYLILFFKVVEKQFIGREGTLQRSRSSKGQGQGPEPGPRATLLGERVHSGEFGAG